MKMDLSWEEILHANHHNIHNIQGANITKKILITIYFLFFKLNEILTRSLPQKPRRFSQNGRRARLDRYLWVRGQE